MAEHEHFHLLSFLCTYCSGSLNADQDLLGWRFSQGNIYIAIHSFTDGEVEEGNQANVNANPEFKSSEFL